MLHTTLAATISGWKVRGGERLGDPPPLSIIFTIEENKTIFQGSTKKNEKQEGIIS